MIFRIDCPCGQCVEVTAIDAGSTRRCGCGEAYSVPRIGELRTLEASGQTSLQPVRVGPVSWQSKPVPEPAVTYSEFEKIRLLDLRGKLPLEKQCLECGADTKDQLDCCIDCEPLPAKSTADRFANFLFGGWIALYFPILGLSHILNSTEEETGEPGMSRFIRTPLRLCDDCAGQLRHRPQSICDLLRKVPLYEPLFRDYPQAEIKIPNL